MAIDKTQDNHMHTLFSDGSGTIDQMAVSAIEKGLSHISITDHMPLPCPRRYTMDKDEINPYRLAVRTAKDKYSDRLNIKMGIEMEFVPEFRFWIQSILEMGWECTIVSVHSLITENTLNTVNGNKSEFNILLKRMKYNIHTILKRYYKTVQAAVETGWFDIVGHLDVIKKHNSHEKYFNESDPFYRNLVLETLDAIQQHQMKMEINLSGLDHPVKNIYPSRWIVHEAVKRGIPIVLGSDAHDPGSIGRHFHTADACLPAGAVAAL